MSLSIRNINTQYLVTTAFTGKGKEISYGYLDLKKSDSSQENKKASKKDKVLAFIGSTTGAAIPLLTFMKRQKAKDIFHVKYNVTRMLTMAACANSGGIMLSSIGEKKKDIIKKWKEGAFQMSLTSLPMLLVDGAIKLCEKSKNPRINNNLMKIIGSVIGVSIGSNTAIFISNKLRNNKEAQKPKRELKLIDMIANLDDAVAICVLAKIPFADKIHIERALPFIYSFCGYRSGTVNKK
jgi:hypothetical protein